MRAAYFTTYGPARQVLQVDELPDPKPGAGEVRVRIRFSGINPSDCNRRSGTRDRPNYPLIVPHSDGSGEIDSVGPGVSEERIGESVWIWGAQRGRAFGTAAEYVALPSQQAVPLPKGVTLEAGACFGVPAMTAYFSLFADGPLADRDVLVTGGAGAVGIYAVQFAMLAGAKSLVTTVSTEAKAQVAADAGAPVIVNYKSEDAAARVMHATGGRGVDRISEVDFGGNLRTTLAVMKFNCAIGAYASKGNPDPTLPFYPLLFNNTVVRFIQCYAMPKDLRLDGVRDLSRWCEQGRVKHPASKVLRLDEIATAHEMVEQGAIVGKVLLSL